MIGAHRADVDCFEAAHTTVVLELHAGKVAHGIGHRVAVEALELLASEFLGGDDVLVGAPSVDNDILDVLHRVQAAMTDRSHHRVGLVCKDAFLSMGAQETRQDKKRYDKSLTHSTGFQSIATWQVF